MKILITNDDGIENIGIRLLAEWAKKLGEVTVIAPKVEQSAKSHAIDFTRPIEIKKVPLCDGVTAYSMDSTPADCVRFGVLGLKEKFDLVLSGINKGVNLGADIVYSGTVGAIYESSRHKIPSIAFSTFPDTQEEACKYFDAAYKFIKEKNLFENTYMLNVNIPANPKGIRVTKQGGIYFSDDFIKAEGENMYVQTGEIISAENPNDLDCDTVAIHNGYISVTPLMMTRTDMTTFEKHKEK
jgi:5'-nucleotidase